jgi:SAM-dependent methyltransferase
VPRDIRDRYRDHPAVQRVAGHRRFDVPRHDQSGEMWSRSRTRWRAVAPDSELTWGKVVSGKPFVDKLIEHTDATSDSVLLEIGPGYGRILGCMLESGMPFAAYHGFDMSPNNVAWLSERYGSSDDRLSFTEADIEKADIPPFDIAYSSLTFKHLYPSFEAALTNLAGSLRPGGRIVFDLIEGDGLALFERDDVTYIRTYTRELVAEIVEAAGLELVALDVVIHDPEHPRLLVVAGAR